MKQSFKFSPEFLLEELLKETGQTRAEYTKKLKKKLKLNTAHLISEVEIVAKGTRPNGKSRIQKITSWATETALIDTTQYGRIKQVQYLTRSRNSHPITNAIRSTPHQPTTPQVTFKRRRKLEMTK